MPGRVNPAMLALTLVGASIVVVVVTLVLPTRTQAPPTTPSPHATSTTQVIAPPAAPAWSPGPVRVAQRSPDIPAVPAAYEVDEEARKTRPTPTSPPQIDPDAAAARDAYAALQREVTREVEGQLAAQRASLAQNCWNANLDPAEFHVEANFSADGDSTSIGVAVPFGDPALRTAGQCLREQTITLQASAHGQAVSVNLPLAFP